MTHAWNPYDNPEKFGLLTVTEVEWYEPSYSFDTTAVLFSPETKEYWWADDSGCSCPSPFEDMTKPGVRKDYEFVNNEVTKGIEAILEFGRNH